jgi:hypothetical protein
VITSKASIFLRAESDAMSRDLLGRGFKLLGSMIDH